MVVNTASKHRALLWRVPLGGAEILSSSLSSGPWAALNDSGFLAFEGACVAPNKIYTSRFNCVLKGKYSHNDCEYNEAIIGSRNPTFTTKQHLAAHC